MHVNYLNQYSTAEVEAAMCIWEECIHRLNEARSRGGVEAQEADPLWNFLRKGEGAASARDTCIDLCKILEYCYNLSYEHFGFDDSFDWEYVGRWLDRYMEVHEDLGGVWGPWLKWVAYKTVEDWRRDTDILA